MVVKQIIKTDTIMGFGSFDIIGLFFGLISIVIGLGFVVCCVILFFKVWGMCNDVRKILQILEQKRFEN